MHSIFVVLSMLCLIMRRLFYIFTVLLLTTSCKQNYTIEGSATIFGLEGKKLFLRTLQKDKWIDLDSADIVHCEFKMHGTIDSTVMASLFLDNQNIMPIVLEKGRIKITMDNEEITARGTILNNTLYEYIGLKNNIEAQFDELSRNRTQRMIESASIRRTHNEFMEEYNELNDKLKRLTDSFIQRNYENVLGPNLFMMSYGTTNYPLLTPDVKSIVDKAPIEFKNNYFIKQFVSKAKENTSRLKDHNRPHSMEYNAIYQ